MSAPTQTRPPAGAGGAASRWSLAPLALVRVAGLPASAAHAVRTPGLHAWAQDVLRRRATRAAATQHLVDAVELLVPDDRPEVRRAALAVRRDLFNGRHPGTAALGTVAAALPPDAAAGLTRWCASARELADLVATGPRVEQDDLAAARATLRAVLRADGMRSAVLLQSEDLEQAMDRYLDATGPLDKRHRKVERSLVDLLLRATLKTSPFSTLTSVGLARVAAPDGDAADATPGALVPRSLRQHATVGVNVAVAARLAAHVCSRPDLRAPFRAAVAPGADVTDDLVRYARRRVSVSADPDAVVAVDGVHEDLFLLPAGPLLREVTDLLTSCASLDELARALRARHPGDRGEDVDAFLGHLLRLSYLVVPELQVDAHAPDPTLDLAAVLARTGGPPLAATARALTALAHDAHDYAAAPARDRRSVLATARGHVQEAFASTGADLRAAPRTVLYEDTTVPSDGLVLDGPTAARLRAALAPLAEIMPALDVNLPRRLMLDGFFAARYAATGRCDDVLQFCHEFQRDFFTPYNDRAVRRRTLDEDNRFVPHENAFRQDAVRRLDEARTLAGALVAQAHADAGPAARCVDLGPAFAEQVAAPLRDVPRLRGPWSYFVQVGHPTPDGEVPCVVNSGYSAFGSMFSRFLHALDAGGTPATDAVRAHLRDVAPPGSVLAEIRGGLDMTNLNLHPAMTTHEIVCPGDVSRRPADEQIALDDLFLVHDADAGGVVLRSRRLGVRVVPVYLGFLMPLALPEVQRVLLCFSPAGMVRLDLWAGTAVPVPPGGVARYPRLTLGPLVLQRELWKVDAAAFPLRATDETSAAHYLRVQEWRAEHGIPELVFAQTDGGGAAGDASARGGSGRKPLPVDFRSLLAVQALERVARGAARRLVLTEALPDPDHLLCHDTSGEAWVTELLVEVYPEGER